MMEFYIRAAVLIGCVALVIRLILKRTIRTAKIRRWWGALSDRAHEQQFFKVPEFSGDGDSQEENHLFRRVSLYLNSLASLEDSDFTNLVSGPDTPSDILLSLDPGHPVLDTFLGARLSWTLHVSPSRSFVLRVRTRDKRRVLRPYLQHIHSVSDDLSRRPRRVRLYANTAAGAWRSVPFTHPATIDTIAMDADLKAKIRSDVESFAKSRAYYHRLGRAWRRSYLLYGPSGTGKSSFVAAMAKLLGYDVYDLDLSRVAGDSDLKLLLLKTTPKSVVLVEDFDRYVGSPAAAAAAASLSGVLNFMDGVVSSCCDERVMVFTMTRKDAVDPAVLRPGRVDVHIYFPMCDFSSFKSLASSYLGVREHKLFPQVEEMFSTGASMSPAEIGELMMANRSSPSRALRSVITALQTAASAAGGRPSEEREREAEEGDDPAGPVVCRDGVKEIRKLYSFIRRRSGRKSGSFDLLAST